MKVIVTFSGGKDSLASLLWTREHITKNFTTVFCDTGWEHPLTYEYINRIADKLHLDLVTLKSKKYDGMVDLARQAPERIDEIATIEQELRSAFFGPDKIPAAQSSAVINTPTSATWFAMSNGRMPRAVCSTTTRRPAA